RFSEDIDLAVDYAALGFTGARDPRREDISKSKRNAILAEMMNECQQYVRGEFLDALKPRYEEVLGAREAWALVSAHRTQTWFDFTIRWPVQRTSPMMFRKWCLSWERTPSLCRMMASQSDPLLSRNFLR